MLITTIIVFFIILIITIDIKDEKLKMIKIKEKKKNIIDTYTFVNKNLLTKNGVYVYKNTHILDEFQSINEYIIYNDELKLYTITSLEFLNKK